MTTSEQSTRLLLIRHGHGRNQSEGRFLQHACTGLTEAGVVQAQALAARLARDPTLTEPVVLASKAKRAIDTAEILAEALSVPVVERTCGLCEVHPGAADGMTPAEMEHEYGPVAGWTRPFQAVPDADNFTDWLTRARTALEQIAATYRGRQILAVTHAAVIVHTTLSLFQVPEQPRSPRRAWLEPTNTGVTEWQIADGRWTLVRYNDTSHFAP